jgi:predicted nuclease of predicted toxin-antitoxin system
MSETIRLFISLYTDEDISSELAPAIRDRGLDAQSAAEAGLLDADDPVHLEYTTARGLTILTCNARDFLDLAKQYAIEGRTHAGIIISSEQYSRRRFGELLRLVLRLMNSISADEMQNRVVYLQDFKK